MSEEIQEAVQIIRVAYDGIEIAMRVGSGGLHAMKKALSFLTGMLEYEKQSGKESMRNLLKRGGDLQVLQLKEQDMKAFKRTAKKYGILYSVLPNVTDNKELTEIVFHSEAVPRINMMIQKLGFGKIASFDSYLKNSDEKQLGKLMDFLNSQKQGNDKVHTDDSKRVNNIMDELIEKVGIYASSRQSISVGEIKENFSIGDRQAEDIVSRLATIGFLDKKDDSGKYKVMMDKEAFLNRLNSYKNLADRIMAVACAKNKELSDVTISKTLIADKSDHAVKTRVPGTWGRNARYIWIHKDDIMEIHNGKTMLTFINTGKEYKMYDSENRVVGTINGKVLYDNHYDRVESSLRSHDEREEKNKGISKNPANHEKQEKDTEVSHTENSHKQNSHKKISHKETSHSQISHRNASHGNPSHRAGRDEKAVPGSRRR